MAELIPAIIYDRSPLNGIASGGIIRTELGWFTTGAEAAVALAELKGPGRNVAAQMLSPKARLGEDPEQAETQTLYVVFLEAPATQDSVNRTNQITRWSFDKAAAEQFAALATRSEYRRYRGALTAANEQMLRAYCNKILRMVNGGNRILTGEDPLPETPDVQVLETEEAWPTSRAAQDFRSIRVIAVEPHREP